MDAVTDILDGIMDKVITSSNMGLFSSAVFLGSLGGNYYLYKKISQFKYEQEKYAKIFIILEPILTKIINEEELTASDIEDVKQIRSEIKFSYKK